MKSIEIFADKVYRKLHYWYINKLPGSKWKLNRYKSYKHLKKNGDTINDTTYLYLTQETNKGAGIGHQMGNWLSGFCMAQRLGLKYAYYPFPDVSMGENDSWDKFLGFGENEITIYDLKKQGYKFVRLPYFIDKDEKTIDLIKDIISSYANGREKVIFKLELDQVYTNIQEGKEHIKKKFNEANSRKNDNLVYSEDTINIALHIRRGDIAGMGKRWLDNTYYAKLLKEIVDVIPDNKSYAIYIFSQGTEADFPEFKNFSNINYCFDMSAKDSFLHMIRADVLLTSKSSFSYKPALLSEGIKICPKEFWHGYPDEKDWILIDEENGITTEQIKQIKELLA